VRGKLQRESIHPPRYWIPAFAGMTKRTVQSEILTVPGGRAVHCFSEEFGSPVLFNQVKQLLQSVGLVGGANERGIGTVGDYHVFEANGGD